MILELLQAVKSTLLFRSGVISDVRNFTPEHVKQDGMPRNPPQACLQLWPFMSYNWL